MHMLLFMDGQAHYDTPRLGMKYSVVTADYCVWSVVAEGRFGNCIKRVATSNGSPAGYLAIAPLTTRLGPWAPALGKGGICGFAIKVDDVSRVYQSLGNQTFFVVMEGADHHVRVGLNKDGTFSLYRNQRGSLGEDILLAQSSEGLTSGTWMFLEFKWLIDPAAGTFEIRVNGITVLTYTGMTQENNLLFVSLGMWTAVRLLGQPAEYGAPWLTLRMCDLYLADTVSADPDDVSDFLGDGIIETILPNAPGASTDFVPSTAPNWDQVNDRPAPDDDGTYVRAVDPGARDLYHFEDIPTGSSVKGIHVNILARKEEEGSSAVAPIVRQGATDYLGATQGVANVTYDRYVTQAWDLNPATLAKFTPAEVNAGQFGVRKVT